MFYLKCSEPAPPASPNQVHSELGSRLVKDLGSGWGMRVKKNHPNMLNVWGRAIGHVGPLLRWLSVQFSVPLISFVSMPHHATRNGWLWARDAYCVPRLRKVKRHAVLGRARMSLRAGSGPGVQMREGVCRCHRDRSGARGPLEWICSIQAAQARPGDKGPLLPS